MPKFCGAAQWSGVWFRGDVLEVRIKLVLCSYRSCWQQTLAAGDLHANERMKDREKAAVVFLPKC